MLSRFRSYSLLALATFGAALIVIAPATAATSGETEDGPPTKTCPRPGDSEGSGGAGALRLGEGGEGASKPDDDSATGDKPDCVKPKPPRKLSKRMAVQEASLALEDELSSDGELEFGKVSCKGSGRNQFTCKTRGSLTPYSDDEDDESLDMETAEEEAEYGNFKATIKVRAMRGRSGDLSVRTQLRVKFLDASK